MRKNVCIVLLLLFALFTPLAKGTKEADSGKLHVITTLFPLYDFSRAIGGGLVDVYMLLPPGTESHTFEPTPRDMIRIEEGKVFVYTGNHMEPWVEGLLKGIKNDTLIVTDTSQGINMFEMDEHHHEEDEHHHEEDEHHHEEDEHHHEEDEHHHEEDEHHHEEDEHHHEEDEAHHHGGVDPHIWLDPVLAKIMVQNIVDAFIKADPGNKTEYEVRGRKFQLELDGLHDEIKNALQHCENGEVIFGGHNAFGYFSRRYGIEFITAYPGFSPDTEPSPARIAGLIEKMKSSELDVVYAEELLEPKVARVIAEETGAQLLILHGAHNLSKKEFTSGITYLDIMYDNLEKLKTGLHYIFD